MATPSFNGITGSSILELLSNKLVEKDQDNKILGITQSRYEILEPITL